MLPCFFLGGGKERKEGGVPLFAVGNVEWMVVYMCSVVECFVLIVFGFISCQVTENYSQMGCSVDADICSAACVIWCCNRLYTCISCLLLGPQS